MDKPLLITDGEEILPLPDEFTSGPQFPDIEDRRGLADFLKIPWRTITHILYVRKIENCYSSFTIPKKSGGERNIFAPCEELKSVQTTLARKLWDYQELIWAMDDISPNISHAFQPGKSIITNAKIHRNKRFVLNLDLKDFFDTIHFGRVLGFFEKNRNFKLPHEVALTLAQLTCYDGHLPQGAPTSPIISNWICQVLDMRLLKIAKKYKLDYTRYADDLTFSTNNRYFFNIQDDFMDEIEQEINRSGFTINEKKTRLAYRDSRQEVTGLVVNKKISVNRQYIRKTRAMAHQLYTTGGFLIDGIPGTLSQLEGRFSFIDYIDRYNNKLESKSHSFFKLSGRERQYQEFLFYKYFIAPEKPVIVTEGKTDPVYLKAALTNMYADYPNLIEKDDSGKFKFKISFFKRSSQPKLASRLSYFFGISGEGADALKYLYDFYIGTDKRINYAARFKKLSGHAPHCPVILIFDNEPTSNYPLHDFLGHANKSISAEDKEKFQSTLSLTLSEDGNLHLLTNPLVKGKDKCEIEDLFPDEVLQTEIDGRRFGRDGKRDKDKFYNKDIFSKQVVMQHYKEIDFSNFKRMLDALDKIIQENTK